MESKCQRIFAITGRIIITTAFSEIFKCGQVTYVLDFLLSRLLLSGLNEIMFELIYHSSWHKAGL